MSWRMLFPKWKNRISGEWVNEMMIRVFVVVIILFVLIPHEVFPTHEVLQGEFLGFSIYAFFWGLIGYVIAVLISIPLTRGISYSIRRSVK